MSDWLYWVIAAIYMIGARETTRMMVLCLIEENQRHQDTCLKCKSHRKNSDYPIHFGKHGRNWRPEDTAVATFVTIFWPVFALFLMAGFTAKHLLRFLRWCTFPRGIETKYAREKRLAAEHKESVKRLEQLATETRELEAAYGLPSLDLTELGLIAAELTARATVDSRPQKQLEGSSSE